MIGLKKLKINYKKEKRKKRKKKEKNKENSTELQKPNIEAEVYNSNKNVTEKIKKLRNLLRFHSASKTDNYNRGRGKETKNKKEKKVKCKNP